MEKKIKKIEFTDAFIVTTTMDGETYYRAISDFPLIYNATQDERNQYTIGKWGDDVRWANLDEDIHISSLIGQTMPSA